MTALHLLSMPTQANCKDATFGAYLRIEVSLGRGVMVNMKLVEYSILIKDYYRRTVIGIRHKVAGRIRRCAYTTYILENLEQKFMLYSGR